MASELAAETLPVNVLVLLIDVPRRHLVRSSLRETHAPYNDRRPLTCIFTRRSP